MTIVQKVINNRTFVLGLDDMYRERMKQHESTELLNCAREVAQTLQIQPVNVPIEGYYHETPQLTEYFKTVRAIQRVARDKEFKVASLDGYQRLNEVTSSRIFGTPYCGFLLENTIDPLTKSLNTTRPWSVDTVVENAHSITMESDDYSLVGVASLTKNPVVLTALRESVVLYAILGSGCCASFEPVEYEYIWEVDSEILKRSEKLISEFNQLFNESLPQPIEENAALFYNAGNRSRINGRCVRIGQDNGMYYHWAIHGDTVKDFWDKETWTTERYRDKYELY